MNEEDLKIINQLNEETSKIRDTTQNEKWASNLHETIKPLKDFINDAYAINEKFGNNIFRCIIQTLILSYHDTTDESLNFLESLRENIIEFDNDLMRAQEKQSI